MPKAIRSQGTKLFYSIGSPSSFTAVGNITNFDGPGGQSGSIDTTDLDDTSYKRFMTGLIDAGEVSFTLNLDPANATHAALKLAQEQGTPVEIKITPPTGALSIFFNAFVKQFRVSAAADASYKAAVALLLDGGYTWA